MSKEAMKMALEALQTAHLAVEDDMLADEIQQAITAILGALAEQPAQTLPFGVGGGLVAIKTLLSRDPCAHANTAIQMIDAILAEQPAQQEPVAWMTQARCFVDLSEFTEAEAKLFGWKPVYTSPPAQRKPLTYEEIESIFNNWPTYHLDHEDFARAIEAAHGIKENT